MRVTLLALALAACGHAAPPAPSPIGNAGGTAPAHVLAATLERTQCYGWCPAYSVAIYRDGAVEYQGLAYVKTKGKATGHITDAQLAELDAVFARAHYLDLKDAYTEYEMTDMPSARTSYALGDRRHAVEHYFGDSHAPAELREVEEAIDKAVDIEHWIGTEKEREALGR